MTYNPNASHHLTYPDSNRPAGDGGWFYTVEMTPEREIKQAEGRVEYYTQMAEFCRAGGNPTGFNKFGPQHADGFAEAAIRAQFDLDVLVVSARAAWEAKRVDAA